MACLLVSGNWRKKCWWWSDVIDAGIKEQSIMMTRRRIKRVRKSCFRVRRLRRLRWRRPLLYRIPAASRWWLRVKAMGLQSLAGLRQYQYLVASGIQKVTLRFPPTWLIVWAGLLPKTIHALWILVTLSIRFSCLCFDLKF